jgi:hypothetical protein
VDAAALEVGGFLEKVSGEFQDYKLVQHSFNRYVESAKKQVLEVLEFDQCLGSMCGLGVREFQAQFELLLEKSCSYFEMGDKPNGEESDIGSHVIQIIHQELKDILQALFKLNEEGKITDFLVLSLFPMGPDELYSFKPHFSEQLKGSCMRITPTTA